MKMLNKICKIVLIVFFVFLWVMIFVRTVCGEYVVGAILLGLDTLILVCLIASKDDDPRDLNST